MVKCMSCSQVESIQALFNWVLQVEWLVKCRSSSDVIS